MTLTYPDEITDLTEYVVGDNTQRLKPLVSFVAIKNGMHQAQGFAFFTSGIQAHAPKDMAHVSNIGKCILSYFGVQSQGTQ